MAWQTRRFAPSCESTPLTPQLCIVPVAMTGEQTTFCDRSAEEVFAHLPAFVGDRRHGEARNPGAAPEAPRPSTWAIGERFHGIMGRWCLRMRSLGSCIVMQ